MNNIRSRIILGIILVLACVLRFWNLGGVPLSLNWDEVALGYNAYSIMLTGKDEYSEMFPIVLQSYNDYKPALYAYLVIPGIWLFGLSSFAVRLPGALSGILAVYLTYVVVCQLFENRKIVIVNRHIGSNVLALIAAFLLAISPWHIQFSRVAFEANVAATINLLAIITFLKGLNNPKFLLLTPLFLSLGIYTYQSEKLFVPILFIILVAVFWKRFWKIDKRYLIMSFVIGIIVSAPMVHFLLTNEHALSRAQGVSVFSSNTTEFLKETITKLEVDRSRGDVLGLVFDNRRVEYIKAVTQGYLSHFDLNWLFITGDQQRHHAPGMGLMYLWELPFLFIGMYTLLFMPIDKRIKLFLFLWFLSAPIPASFTTDLPHAVRTINILPTLQIFTGLGLISTYVYLRKLKNRFLIGTIGIVFMIVIVCNIFYYLNQYFVQQNYRYALDWQAGFQEMVTYIKPIQNKYEKIIVSNENEMSQSYMFFLFYLQYDPRTYLKEGGTNSGSFDDPNRFGNFEFRRIDYQKEAEHTLLVGSMKDFDEVYKTVHEVYYPNKSVAMRAVEK